MAEQLQLESGVVLDARGAAWFGEAAMLALAGVQLGAPATSRPGGPTLALSALDDAIVRFSELLADYRPLRTVVLGTPLAGALSPPLLEHVLKSFVAVVACHGELVVVGSDPGQQLESARQRWGLSLTLQPRLEADRLLFVEGDEASAGEARNWLASRATGGLIVFNREHPTVTGSRRLLTVTRCPCFLVGADRLCLPAYSPGVRGVEVGAEEFRSPLAREANWQQVVAIAGQRLLRLAWDEVAH